MFSWFVMFDNHMPAKITLGLFILIYVFLVCLLYLTTTCLTKPLILFKEVSAFLGVLYLANTCLQKPLSLFEALLGLLIIIGRRFAKWCPFLSLFIIIGWWTLLYLTFPCQLKPCASWFIYYRSFCLLKVLTVTPSSLGLFIIRS